MTKPPSQSNPSDEPTVPPAVKPESGNADLTVPPRSSEVTERHPFRGQPDDVTLKHAPQIDGYELIEELGRGGMGLVYRARNRKLDREVAIKMILGGNLASEDQVQRFLHEAESVAKLDHPAIVPIYEIGQTAGHHFFAMKLIGGQPLSQCRDQFQVACSQAVELMVSLADAVNHAHQRGILHRDLKPANILIDEQGQPHITDFGLAKHLDGDHQMTRTGSVMGSPGFMAPEQASGQSDVTTAVDVYALGALLYWILAGRPPIDGHTHMDVIMRTISEEPSSIQTHNRNVDSGLNLICQKALSKKPENRYDSASEFAEDLQAWLVGEPLSVRPPTTVGLVGHWVRKHARTVVVSSAFGLLCGCLVGAIIFLLIVRNLLDEIRSAGAQLGDAGASWVTQYFSWVDSVPTWLVVILPPTIVWLTVGLGIAMIYVIRPKSREIGMVAATTAALLVGIASFSISFGWSSIAEYGVYQGTTEIEILAHATWIQSDTERQLVTRGLLDKYPGLASVDVADRGALLTQKIVRSQILGIPRGIWNGIALTLCLGTLPFFFSAAYSSLLWNLGNRRFAFVGKAIELAIYSALFFLMFSKFTTNNVGYYPGFLTQALTLAGIGAALAMCLKGLSWPWRILAFAIVNICVFVNMAESSRIANARQLGAYAKTETQWQACLHYLEKRIAVNDNSYDRYLAAVLSAHLGRAEHYQRHCQDLRADLQNLYRPASADRLVKAHLLQPELHEDLSYIYELADSLAGYETWPNREWLLACSALADLRRDRFSEVFATIKESRKVALARGNGNEKLFGMLAVIEGLALQDSGGSERIDGLFVQAREAAKTRTTSNWHDALVIEVLLRKAAE